MPYQGYDDRALQSLYGSLVCRIMAELAPPVPLAAPPAPDEKVRVGIVSGFFLEHTIWKLLICGWLARLDRQRFQVFGYHTGGMQDAATLRAAALCDKFVMGRRPGPAWRDAIGADAPHVLLYPEIGMDAVATQLAAQRLAPTQCMAWGHPETSGMPTIDYFLSSDLMEPQNGQDHYTERLVRLPNLAIWYEPADWRPVPLGRAELGLRPSATVYWSGQALYKYLPQYDQVFARIALEVSDCQFVFIEYARSRHVTEQFWRRLQRAFAAHGLKAEDHCVVLPSLDPDRFISAVGLADVVLDTIGWSGGQSTLDCLIQALPMVTMPGTLMRSRHTAAILGRLGVTGTIVDSVDQYVGVAVALAWDHAWRAALTAKILDNRHRVYRDDTTITALEDFLLAAVRTDNDDPSALGLRVRPV